MTMPGDVSQPHPASTLLPWYLTGTLKESERRAVEEHLAGCADCRVELENLTRLRIPLKTVLSEEPMPALQVKQSVMAQIHVERPSASPFEMAVRRGGIGEELEQWFRNLFAPRWIPALAATLLVGQLGLLLWTAGEQTPVSPKGIVTRSVMLVPAPVRVALTFKDSTTEARIRAAIFALKGRLVDGPTTDGAYIVEVPAAETAALDARLQTLRQQSTAIRRAERLGR